MEDAPHEAMSSARAAGSTRSIASAAPDHFGVNVFCLEDEARRHCCRRRPHKQKRRLPKEAAFFIRTSKEEDFLSFAGLAATYSPRA
jgi:hypothetical protein